MSDLIDRQQAIDALKTVAGVGNRALDKLRQLPSAQPKTGKWDFIGYQQFQCTKCGVIYTQEQLEGVKQSDDDLFPNYCPNCGANMQKVECDAVC